jgi:hypothetical protein
MVFMAMQIKQVSLLRDLREAQNQLWICKNEEIKVRKMS